jgi:phosphohistidine phosphatase
VRLYVVRHGIAEDAAPSGRDADRRLTAAGRTKMRAAAVGLQALGVRFDAIVTSPLPRAAETAAILAAAQRDGPTPEPLPALAADSSPHTVVRALRPWAARSQLAVVGHEPTLSELCALLLTGSTSGVAIAMKKGMCVALDLDDAPGRGRATLAWALTPRALRRLRG